jgi:hypothetical protein
MNSSAYILGIGDALLLWRGDLDSGTVRTARGLLEIADSSARYGLGMEHARRLRELADDSAARADPDYGLAIWHLSAYLCGTLDLRSEPLLTGFLQPTNRTVFANVAGALALLSGEDVIAPLRDRKDVTKTEEEAAAAKARNWWHAYLRDHADGDWRPAAQATLQRAGYLTAKDSLRKNASPAQLLAAIRSHDRLVRYAAYRLLNDTYGANFDLQSVFCSGKYAMSFRNPEGQEDATERNLREYWERRFTNGSGR